MPAGPDEALNKRLRQDLIERLTERKGDIFWTGVAFAVVGILALLFPFFTTMAVAFMIGWVLIFAGAVTIYGSFSVQGTGPFFGQMLLGLLSLAFRQTHFNLAKHPDNLFSRVPLPCHVLIPQKSSELAGFVQSTWNRFRGAGHDDAGAVS